MEQIETLVLNQPAYFLNENTLSYSFRKDQLQKLKQMLRDNETDIYEALKTDLNKSQHETLTTELGLIYGEIDFALKNLQRWMEPDKVAAPMTHKGTRNYIMKEPYGITLIIASLNYPLQLALAPAIGAIAAVHCIVSKPSGFAHATSSLLKNMIQSIFDKSYFSVIEGDKNVRQNILKQKFNRSEERHERKSS